MVFDYSLVKDKLDKKELERLEVYLEGNKNKILQGTNDIEIVPIPINDVQLDNQIKSYIKSLALQRKKEIKL